MPELSTSKDGNVWRSTSGLQKGVPSKSVHPSSPKVQEEYDVIVIGAGFTGLTAARDLGPKVNTLLIDARDRIGGRTWTANIDGQDIEMGGMWIHWWQTFVWNELMRYELHKNIVTASGTSEPGNAYLKDSQGLKAVDPMEYSATVDRLVAGFCAIDGLTLQNIVDHPYDTFHKREAFQNYDSLTSLERIEQMDLKPEEKVILATFVSNFGLCKAEEIGFAEMCKWFSLTGSNTSMINETMGKYKLGCGGTTSLANAILADYAGDRLFNAPVKRVTQSTHFATVETHKGQVLKAKYVICTAPLNVLKDIEFSPQFSALRWEAVQKGHPGRGGKIMFTVSPPEPTFISSASLPTDLTFLFTTHESVSHDIGYLVSFVHSDSQVRDFSDSDAVKKAFEGMLPPTSKSEVVSYAYHDWRNDPYAQGTWCCFEASYNTKYLRELQSTHGERVFMASSDYADGWRGCIDGAIEQGIRSSMAVKKLLFL